MQGDDGYEKCKDMVFPKYPTRDKAIAGQNKLSQQLRNKMNYCDSKFNNLSISVSYLNPWSDPFQFLLFAESVEVSSLVG